MFSLIPHHDGLRAPTLNNFSLDCEHYQQISRVAMGTKMSPNNANLFIGLVEEQIFERCTDSIPEYLGRHAYYYLGTASSSRVKLDVLLTFSNLN
jgi:hypothetical protein